jgi:magnesium-transporting ATPase (P-type)
MQPNNQHPKTALYWLLLAIQIAGAISFVFQELPEFGQVLNNPGEQLPKNTKADLMVAGIFFVMQIAFWIRVRSVPIPFRRPNMFLNHVFLFFGRLSFIFGSALFSVVVFRHLPELSRETDFLLMAQRGTIFVGCLFALFCTSLEVERLGQAFEDKRIGPQG